MHHGQREATSWLLHAGIHVSEAYEEVGTKAIRERPERSTGEPRELVWLGDRRLETKHWKEACDFQAFLAEESQSPVLCSTAWDFRNCLRQDVRPPPPPSLPTSSDRPHRHLTSAYRIPAERTALLQFYIPVFFPSFSSSGHRGNCAKGGQGVKVTLSG